MGGWRAAALVACAVLIAAAGAFLVLRSIERTEPPRRAGAARLMGELMSGTAAVGGPFTLTDTTGASRSLREFQGKLVLLYFGFTYCPDICPTDLLAIGEAVKNLGPDAGEVQPLFVTLDPARDTPEVLTSYARSFHPSFLALRGSEAEVRAVATSYKVFFEKVRTRGSDTYMIDHMTLIFVLDREGKYLGALPGGTPAQRIEVFVREMLGLP